MGTESLLAALLAGVAGVTVASFGGLRRVIEAAFDRWARRLAGQAPGLTPIALFGYLAEFNAILSETKTMPTVSRVLVFVGRNGGGLPEPGKKYTVHAQTGWDSSGSRIHERFAFDLIIDDHYADMLLRAHRNGWAEMIPDQMPECLLKRIYRGEGVKNSLIYGLTHDPSDNSFAYASFASYTGRISDDDRAALDVLVHRIRGLLLGRPRTR